jgi:hypothetical protein
VYGRLSLTTDPFYKDYRMMQHGYLHKRYRVTAWFVCRLEDGMKDALPG